jgi:hypothetical protein
MAFQISPGVNVSEIDLTDSVPQNATTSGGLVGIFSWGPLGLPDKVQTVSTTTELTNMFGVPSDESFMSYFTGKNYLSYSSDLKISRLYNPDTSKNAVDSAPLNVSETIHKFINFSNEIGGVIQSTNNYVNDGVSHHPSSWSGEVSSEFTNSPYSMGAFFEGDTFEIGAVYSNGSSVSVNNDLVGVPTDWLGNFTHTLGSPSVFKSLDDLITVTLFTISNPSTGVSPLSGDSFNPWTVDSLNNTSRLSFYSLPSLLRHPIGDVISIDNGVNSGTFTATSGVLDVPVTITDIKFGSSFGTLAGGGTITISSPSSTTDAVLDVTVTIDGSGDNTIVVNSMSNQGVGLDVNELTFDYTGLPNPDVDFTTVTGFEVVVPQRDTFNLPSAMVVSGGSVKIISDSGELSPVTQYNILPDTSANELIYITDTLYSGVGTPRQFILESIGSLFEIRTSNPVLIKEQNDVDSYGLNANETSLFAARYPGVDGNSLRVYLIDIDTVSTSIFVNNIDMVFDTSNDLAVVITKSEENSENTVISEVFINLTKGTGTENWITTINSQSEMVWVLGVPDAYRESPTQRNVWNSSLVGNIRTYVNLVVSGNHEYILSGGDNGTMNIDDWDRALEPFRNKEVSDISLLFGAGDGLDLITYKQFLGKLTSVSSSRKDIVSILSPHTSCHNVDSVIDFFTDVRSVSGDYTMQSYSFADSNFKWQYDVFNDFYRWVPLCGDIAGVMSRTDDDRDPWFSPAGFNRGGIKNVVKLRMSQNKIDRDRLYKESINPVCTFPGQGTILYGDKTFTKKSSSFDRINVRRLFIVLEKLIEAASNQTLFEFNDDFTRSQFVSMVEPFLRDVKGRRGIYEFKVVCDGTNNTSTVIDSNRFVGDIYIKPSRSINFIQLNFVAVATGIEFNEIVGNF